MDHDLSPVAQESELRAVVASTPEEVDALRAEWSLLRKRYGVATPDADPNFFLSILRALGSGSSPHVVVFRNGDHPRALIVGRLNRQPIECRLGYLSFRSPQLRCLEVVYGGLITNNEPSSQHAVHGYLATMLAGGTIDLLDIHHLDVDHELASELVRGLEIRAKVVRRPEIHWVIDLLDPATGQRAVTNSPKTRSTFRRRDRNLVRHFDGRVDVRTFTIPSEVETFIRHADSITSQTYQAALQTGVQDTPRWRVIVQALAETGHLRGYVLRGGTQPIAYILGSLFDQQFTLFATGFLPDYRSLSSGTVLLNRVLDSLAEEKVELFDLGSLYADYKRLHATRVLQEMTLHLYARGWRAALARRMEKASMTTNELAKRTAEKLGVLKKVKKKWRDRLARRQLK